MITGPRDGRKQHRSTLKYDKYGNRRASEDACDARRAALASSSLVFDKVARRRVSQDSDAQPEEGCLARDAGEHNSVLKKGRGSSMNGSANSNKKDHKAVISAIMNM